ncbi:MAG: 50S ribosomal protein L13 [Kiritimatiellae bacterium]|nr:50S ribosomal protein L13 [Kiritimatiellia bacterium]
MKTTLIKETGITRKWFLVDAQEKPTGQLAVEISTILRGKNKPTYAPHQDQGDFVVVVNAKKVKFSGAKEEKKIYQHYTGYPGGLKQYPAATVREKHPERILEQAVKGMLPKNKLSRTLIKRLKVYAGEEHPHAAQNPETLELL